MCGRQVYMKKARREGGNWKGNLPFMFAALPMAHPAPAHAFPTPAPCSRKRCVAFENDNFMRQKLAGLATLFLILPSPSFCPPSSNQGKSLVFLGPAHRGKYVKWVSHGLSRPRASSGGAGFAVRWPRSHQKGAGKSFYFARRAWGKAWSRREVEG